LFTILTMKQKVIGFLCFDDVVALDITGPAEAFASAYSTSKNSRPRPLYKTLLIGLNDTAVVSESGIKLEPNKTIRDCSPLDTLIVPGGRGLREKFVNRKIVNWIRTRAKKTRRIASVCTGIYGLAPTGLVDNRCVTTHWRFADDVATTFPKLKVNGDAIFIKDGPMYTSAGATAGIDLALELIEEDHGHEIALSVARELIVYIKRPGGQRQFSQLLQFQVNSTDEFANLTAWINDNLHLKLSVADLARKVSLCPRHFSRKFKEQIGCSPATFIENARLQEACNRLTMSVETIQNVAESIGYQSSDVFRRSFERRFGVTPSHYCDRFNFINKDDLDKGKEHI